MKELLAALKANGYAKNTDLTLSTVIAHSMQDAQFSSAAAENVRVLRKYETDYGNIYVKSIYKFDPDQ
jgi:hypothetical protein